MTDTVLSDEQLESFVEHGHVTIRGCFTREDAQPWLDEAWVRLGYDPDDPGTWIDVRRQERMREQEEARLAEVSS
jgi:hypothetical protein